jgi:hypothetical protein
MKWGPRNRTMMGHLHWQRIGYLRRIGSPASLFCRDRFDLCMLDNAIAEEVLEFVRLSVLYLVFFSSLPGRRFLSLRGFYQADVKSAQRA